MGGAAIFGFGLAMAAGLFWLAGARGFRRKPKERSETSEPDHAVALAHQQGGAKRPTSPSESCSRLKPCRPPKNWPPKRCRMPKGRRFGLYSVKRKRLFTWLDDVRHSVVVSGHDGPINSVAMTADGSRIVSGSDDETVGFWDAKGTETLIKFDGHSTPVRSVAITPDGNRIVSGSDDKTVRLWDAGGVEVLQLAHPAPVRSVAITSDGRLIASGSADGIVRVWDGTKSAPPIELKGHRDAVNSVAITPDGSLVVSGSNDGSGTPMGRGGTTRASPIQAGRRRGQQCGDYGRAAYCHCRRRLEWHRGCLG